MEAEYLAISVSSRRRDPTHRMCRTELDAALFAKYATVGLGDVSEEAADYCLHMGRHVNVQRCWRCRAVAMQWNDETKDVHCARCGAVHPLWSNATRRSLFKPVAAREPATRATTKRSHHVIA